MLALLLRCSAALRLSPVRCGTTSRCSPVRCCDGGLACGFYGVSVSEGGLVALISGGGRTVPIAVTDSDKVSASSPEALCMLQLLQQIDLGGTVFPPEALSNLVGAGAMLRAVEIDRSATFSLSVASSVDLSGVVSDVSAFEALALALRYNAPLRAEAGLFDSATAFDEDDCSERFPRAFTRADAMAQKSKITRQLAGLGEMPEQARAPTAAGEAEGEAGQGGFSFADQGSLDIVEAVAQAVPAAPAPPRRIDGPDAAVLQGALKIARQRGDAAAEEKILARLEEMRRLDEEA